MTAYDVAFAGFGVVAVASGLLAVTTRQVVHAALWLVVALGSIAGCYLVMGAEFVALIQVLVYVGAIVVLVLFALMLTKAPIGRSPDLSTSPTHRGLAAMVGGGAMALLLATLLPLAGGPVSRSAVDNRGLATDLFATWVWPFELLSGLLLAALVAAFAVSRIVPKAQGEEP